MALSCRAVPGGKPQCDGDPMPPLALDPWAGLDLSDALTIARPSGPPACPSSWSFEFADLRPSCAVQHPALTNTTGLPPLGELGAAEVHVIPLPAAGWLLVTALVALVALKKGKQS